MRQRERAVGSKTRIRRFSRLFVAVLPVFVMAAVLAARLSGYQFHVISSGSMQPTYKVGDIVVGKSVPISTLHQSDIITIRDSQIGVVAYHRVHTIALAPAGQIIGTAGDANRTAETDPK